MGYLEQKLTQRFGDRPLWALVTGGSRHPGVGSGIAAELMNAGFNLVVHCGRSARNPWLDERATGHGRKIVQLQADFAEPGGMRDLAARMRREAAEVRGLPEREFTFDVIAHAAGLTDGKPATQTRCEDVERLLRINALSPMALTNALWDAGAVTTPGGLIVFIGSVHWQVIYRNLLAYGVSKSAVERLALYFAADLAPHGVQVVHTTLGFVDVDRHRQARQAGEYDYLELVKEVPIRAASGAWECGAEVLGLLMTPSKIGNASRMDGGFHLQLH